ncbi:MAG: hypothetical protein JRF63_15640 [Deltaproteobacteria bacterium]|nr:hypothetical protein [Deltaproteobacteria bacterium]
MLGAYLHFPDVPGVFPEQDEAITASVTRLMFDGWLGTFTDYEVNLYLELSRSPGAAMGGAFDTVGSFETPYRSPYLTWDFWETDAMLGQAGVDRLAFDFDAEPLKVSVGRMPINHAVTYIFTPNDFFAPFSATAVNKIYKPGVDALCATLATGALSSIEIDGVLGSDAGGTPGWSESALIARASAVALGFEWALIGGKLAERWVAGASLQGEAGPISIRGEGHAGFPDSGSFHARFALGADAMFAWRNASIGTEYMFISDGATDPADYIERAGRFYPDDQLYLGRHYTGLAAGLDLVGILRLQIAGLLNMADLSGLGMATLVYNIADEAELVGGVLIPWGARPEAADTPFQPPSINSEFGLMTTNVFLETRFYF